jgi:integrase
LVYFWSEKGHGENCCSREIGQRDRAGETQARSATAFSSANRWSRCFGLSTQDRITGRWFLRRNVGRKYTIEPIGLADDGVAADGQGVLTFEQAKSVALASLERSTEGIVQGRLTVRKAMARYIDYLASQGKRTLETERRAAALILPTLGDIEVAALTSERIRKWLASMAASPALLRSKRGDKKKNTRPEPGDDPEAIRRRRSSANRVLTMLKAALNHAYDEKLVSNNEAWGRRVKPFRDVDAARTRYLNIAEAKRLLNACDPSFRALVQGALETGCRYGELCRLEVQVFNEDSGTVAIRRSKSAKARHVVLSEEGVSFFSQMTAGRIGTDFIFINAGKLERAEERTAIKLEREGKANGNIRTNDKGEWRAAEQTRPMKDACERAKIIPPISIHGLRHTWASLAAMAGVPLMVVAKNLGHADTRMVEKHYGHLAPSFVADAIRAGAPKFGFVPDSKLLRMKAR